MLFCLAVFLVPCVQGCLESESNVIIEKDGSGRLEVMCVREHDARAEVGQSQPPENATFDQQCFVGLIETEQDLKRQFLAEGVEIEQSLFEEKDGKSQSSYTVTFDSLQNVLAAKALEKGQRVFFRDKNYNLGFQIDADRIRNDVLQQKKTEGPFSFRFTLVLPGKILESNADQIDGNTLVWSYDQEKAEPKMMNATCGGAGLSFLDFLPEGPRKTKTISYVYDPTGKPDPFKPFLVEIKRHQREAEKILQPLQRYEISQLKLVGVIWNIDNPRALLEDSAGKGYIVTRGAFIGKNQGKVTKILKNEIVVSEEATDIFGETKTRSIRIKLHTGEEER